jgi:hypothetical protein
LRLTIEVTRKDGRVEKFDLIGHVVKEDDHGSDALADRSQCCD